MEKDTLIKKKDRKKLWGIIGKVTFALILVSTWTIIGVALALKNASVNISGQIIFNANDVQVKVSNATFTDFGCNTAGKCIGFETNSSTKEQPDISSWTGLVLAFKESGENAIITYTITNVDQNEDSISVVFGEIGGLEGNNGTMDVSIQEGTLSENVFAGSGNVEHLTAEGRTTTLAVGKTIQVKITFSITDKNKSASISNFNIPIEMTKITRT